MNHPWPQSCGPWANKAQEVQESLTRDSDGLFVKGDDINADLVVTNNGDTRVFALSSEKEIEAHDDTIASEPQTQDPTKSYKSTFFLLRPSNGWSEILMTMDGILSILSKLQAFPQIWSHLKLFGKKNLERDEALGAFDVSSQYENTGALKSIELSYIVKYVELKAVGGSGTSAWSIRHCLIYQKASPVIGLNHHLFVRISNKMMQCLQNCLLGESTQVQDFASDWTRVHLLFLESVEAGFRDYTNCLDEEINRLFDRVILSGTDPAKLREFDTPEQSARDMKEIQCLGDLARRLATTIRVNLDTLQHMKYSASQLKSEAGLQEFKQGLERSQWGHKYALKNVSVLVERAEALSQQLRDTIVLRNSEINRLHAEEAERNTAATLELSERSGYEAHVVKALTVIALIYAPASFASDFLQMDYVDMDGDGFTVSTKPGLKLYFVIAFPLICMTIIIYLLVEWSKRRRLRIRQDLGGKAMV